MTAVKESQCRIVAENRRKQDEVKENSKLSNSVKRSAHIIKQGSLYNNILSDVENLLSSTNNMEDYNGSILQATPPLPSSETLKEVSIHMD